MKGSRRTVLCACLSALLLVIQHASAQQGTSFQPFAGSIEVNLVNVDVWVTDSRGNGVEGLTSADFQIWEDGNPVEISHFREVREGRSLEAAQESTGVGEGASQVPAEPAWLVLYFDQLHLSSTNSAKIIKELRRFVADANVPAEQVLVLSQTEDLTIEAPFGTDAATLDATLVRLADQGSAGGMIGNEKMYEVSQLQELWKQASEQGALVSNAPSAAEGTSSRTCDWFVPRAVAQIESFAGLRRQRVLTSLSSLAQTAGFLSGIEGIKTLLYISDALETNPGADLMSYVDGICPSGQTIRRPGLMQDELDSQFKRLTSHASTNRVTINVLQSSGLTSDFGSSAQHGSLDARGLSRFTPMMRSQEQSGMNIIAAQTGGKTLFNSVDFSDDLAAIDKGMGSYYSLAYHPLHGGDGQEHEIKVKVNGDGIVVRHRQRYLDKNADQRMSERLESAIQLGLMANPLAVKLGAGTLKDNEDGSFTLPLHVVIPPEKLAFLPAEEGYVAQIKVQVTSIDEHNRQSPVQQKIYAIPRPEDQEGSLIDLAAALQLGGGAQVLGVAVKDMATRETSYVATSVNVGPAPAPSGS